jgi:hypothetical protein
LAAAAVVAVVTVRQLVVLVVQEPIIQILHIQ